MRRGRFAGAAGVVAVVVGLSGCSQATLAEDPDVTVSGDAGGAPTVTYVVPLVVERPFRQTIWPGTGPALVDGQPVLLRYWVENGTDATVVTENFSTSPVPQLLTEGDLGEELYATLSGQRVGARLLQVTPPGDEPEEDYPAVTVVDVLPTRADGPAVTPRDGLPVVTLAGDGAPSITPTGADPPATAVVQPLLRGSGRQVAAGDVVTVQYTGFSWTTGEAFDSTWDRGQPMSFSLSDVPECWSDGLTEQPAGSQVMLVVPPSCGLGATSSEELTGQTLVFVVDVLATGPEGVSR